MTIEIKGGEVYINGKRVLWPRDSQLSPASVLFGISPAGSIVPIKLNDDGKLEIAADITLEPGDIKIGAVEIQDRTSETRLDIVDEGAEITGEDNRTGILILARDSDDKARLLSVDTDGKLNIINENLDASLSDILSKLTSIDGKNFATETTLSGVKTQTDKLAFDGSNNLSVNVAAGSITVDEVGIVDSGDNRIDPAKEGGNLASVKTNTDKLDVNLSTIASETTLSTLDGKITTTINGVKTDGSAVTQPISAAALPLPAGASTESKQDNAITKLTSIDGKDFATLFNHTKHFLLLRIRFWS